MNLKKQACQNALMYLSKGLSVIPVGKDKKPLISWSKYQKQRATETEIKNWFKQFPDAQIGIVTGKISGIIVIDVEKGGTIKQYPNTLTASTGGGGYHLYYGYVEGVQNSVRIKELTDIRSDGGYVIAPPSETEKGEYRWISVSIINPFPVEMFKNIEKQKTENPIKEIPEYDGTNEGGRNDKMTRYIGLVLRLVHPLDWETKAWGLIKTSNQKNSPPLDEFELRTTFNSISNREKDKPSGGAKYSPIIEESSVEDDEILLMSEVADKQHVGRVETFPTGFIKFDEAMCGGFKEGDLIVITAPTGQGKTTFAQTLTCNISKKNISVLFFSFEVLVRNLWDKFQEMGMSKSSVVYSPMKISNGTIDWVEKRVLNGIEKFGIKVVVLDHLGFLLPKKVKYDNQMNSNYSAFLGGICRDLKVLAIKNKLIILLLAHVRKTDKPTINDIRDSSGIAQEADHVFILERQKSGKDDQTEYSNDTMVTLAKNRLTGLSPRILCTLTNSKFNEKYDTDIKI